eukprot:CAMPEP_0177645316 /NCGR_PEP_ID=MMETSP0447-20121125/9184_1 /TAXON_ID=0 /ORGANISM="Stygamoeba regulata, Strain BSH-02190019" /LENGTH=341 /DNA_ID=CAMNT_0019147791 /DNA_START=80 /DNA_END=1105 /DNA_ORIENTATION=-
MSASSSSVVNVLLCGLGRIGTVHYKNLLSNARAHLRYIFDVDQARAEELAAAVPGGKCRAVSSLAEALADPELHAVIVCTPTASHTEIIIAAAKAKKTIMCEKPISLHLDEIDQCFAAAKENNVPLLCGFQRRHDPSFAALQKAVKEGKIGTCQVIKTCSRDNPVPSVAFLKISGGFFHDCASHDIDVCRWISGEDPISVYATGSCFRSEIKELDDFDTAVIVSKYPSGILSSIDISRKATYGYDQRIEVLGDGGMLTADNRATTTVILSDERGHAKDVNCYSFPQRYVEAYAIELNHFMDVAQGLVEPMVNHADCRKAAIIAEAAEQSAKTGVPVVPKFD